jgi:hypothetical protein
MKRGSRTSPKRKYDNRIDTTVRALDAIYGTKSGLRALSRLESKWPETNWPQRLAEIHVAVLCELGPIDPLLEDRK